MPGLQRFLRDEVFFSAAAALVFFVVFLRTTPRGHATTLIFETSSGFSLLYTMEPNRAPGLGSEKTSFSCIKHTI